MDVEFRRAQKEPHIGHSEKPLEQHFVESKAGRAPGLPANEPMYGGYQVPQECWEGATGIPSTYPHRALRVYLRASFEALLFHV